MPNYVVIEETHKSWAVGKESDKIKGVTEVLGHFTSKTMAEVCARLLSREGEAQDESNRLKDQTS
jgi:hypothetical protein